MVTLHHLAPYVVASHARDSAVWPHPRGCAWQWVAMGDGNVGIKAWSQAYCSMCATTSYTMEIITGVPPRILNYLEPEYWEAFPDTPSWEFARFEQLVRHGTPYVDPMVAPARGPIPPEYEAALAVQDRIDLERSVRWVREELGLGERA